MRDLHTQGVAATITGNTGGIRVILVQVPIQLDADLTINVQQSLFTFSEDLQGIAQQAENVFM
ncbi:MAG TPA: hypothetical protein PLV25_05180 [Opitutales bacterium]|nr:hypothetical protein [Opitutales bacterium]